MRKQPPVRDTSREKEAIRAKILQQWDALDEEARKDRRAVVRRLSATLDMPALVVEQHLAEWESSKGG